MNMNPENNQLDDLRLQWQALKIDNQRLEEANRKLSQKLAAEKAETRQRKLAGRYRFTGILGIFLLPMIAIEMYTVGLVPVWMCWLYGIVGFILGVLNVSFSFYISGNDYLTLPTCEAVRHATKVILWQSRLRNMGLILAALVVVPLIAHFALHLSAAILIGSIIGLCVGLTCGLSLYSRNRRLARRMLSDFEN